MDWKHIRWSWVTVFMTGSVVFGLGLFGFLEHFKNADPPRTFLDVLYETGNLFFMGGSLEGPLPRKLELARFAAPLITFYAIFGAVYSLFSVEFRRLRLRLGGGHVIVCGMGQKGSRLVEELRQEKKQVVVIEPDEHNPDAAKCRRLGCLVIHGRSDDDWVLQRALLRSADTLIATTGDDGTNIETVIHAHRVLEDDSGSRFRCIVHITDPSLQMLLKRHQIFADDTDRFQLEIVNVYETGARLMLNRSGLFGAKPEQDPIRLCLLGFGTFGEAVFRRVLREWAARGWEGTALEIALLDSRATEIEQSIRQRYRDYFERLDLRLMAIPCDARSTGFVEEELETGAGARPFDAYFICFDDDPLATLATLQIRNHTGPETTIVVRLSEELGFANLLKQEARQGGSIAYLHPVGFLDVACMRDLFLGGDREQLARALHEVYLETCRTAGETVATRPNALPWHDLPPDARDENRHQADRLRENLKSAGLELVACPDRFLQPEPLPEEAVEALACAEHDRWKEGKQANGWRHAETRDDSRKLHPLLLDWEELPKSEKQRNRNAARQWPEIVARADFEIVEQASGELNPR